jgi:hypothetical protein
VFPVRYGLDLYILFRRNSVFKGLIHKADIKLLSMSVHFLDVHFYFSESKPMPSQLRAV